MSIDKISRKDFDNIDNFLKDNFNATIVEKMPLEEIGDWYREIDISEDQQMVFFRTGTQISPVKFDQIESAESIEIPYNAGKHLVRETDNHLGLTALGALCGWLIVSQTTTTKEKDRIIKINVLKINLRNHPTEKKVLFLCTSHDESLRIRVKLNSYIKQYEHDQDGNHFLINNDNSHKLFGASLLLFLSSPIWGLIFGSWKVFFSIAGIAGIGAIATILTRGNSDNKEEDDDSQAIIDALFNSDDINTDRCSDEIKMQTHDTTIRTKSEPEEKEGFVIYRIDKDNMDFSICLPKQYFNEACRNDYAYVPKDVWDNAMKEYNERKEWNERLNKTAELNNMGSEYEKMGDIEKAIECYEENVKMGYPATHSYNRLMILYSKLKRTQDEIRIVKLAIKQFPEDTKYVKRLKKLNGSEDPVVLPQTAIISHPRIIYGEKMEEEIKKLPEFDFYSQGYDNTQYYQDYIHSGSLEPIYELQRHFKDLLDSASAEEDFNNLAGASVIYEQIIAERYWMPAPYDKLIKIYSKAKLKEDEKRILKIAIEHFKNLKRKRYDYVHELAEKYNALDFFKERVKEDKKITYFNGIFELYNPFTIISKWDERLAKIK